MNLKKKGQQEIAGFVFIVVLVLIAMIVFVVISLRQGKTEQTSKLPEAALSALMSYTSECVISPPERESVRDLIKSCYENEKCDNLGIMSCAYEKEIVEAILTEVLKTDLEVTAYEFNVDWISEDQSDTIRQWNLLRGKCNQTDSIILGSSEDISVDNGNLKVSLKVCTDTSAD